MEEIDKYKERLSYCPEAGVFTWLKTDCKKKTLIVAGTKDKEGYIRIHIFGKKVAAHRLAWLFTHGVWPKEQIDHINGVRDDNRIENLREATKTQNGYNRAAIRGLKGVDFNKASAKVKARVRVEGRSVWLGSYDTEEAAHEAYLSAAKELHKEYFKV
jgi:hypothetical protein